MDAADEHLLKREATPGKAYTIARLEFVGNQRIRDRVLAKRLRLTAGTAFVQRELDEGLRRLTQHGSLQPVNLTDVALCFNDLDGTVTLAVRVQER